MASATVFVFDSAAKRTQVKVTPGTHMRDVLEEACKARKWSPESYVLKTQKDKPVDLSQPFRLSGLIGGAKLTLVQASRSASVVNVAIQLPDSEGGGRLSDKFPSTTSLWLVLRKFEDAVAGQPPRKLNLTQRGVPSSQSAGSGRLIYEQPCVHLMGRNMETFVDLQKTLAQLGLNSGSVLIRLTFKSVGQPLEEAMQEIEQYFKAVDAPSTESEKSAQGAHAAPSGLLQSAPAPEPELDRDSPMPDADAPPTSIDEKAVVATSSEANDEDNAEADDKASIKTKNTVGVPQNDDANAKPSSTPAKPQPKDTEMPDAKDADPKPVDTHWKRQAFKNIFTKASSPPAPGESKPQEGKPEESKPEESKPSEDTAMKDAGKRLQDPPTQPTSKPAVQAKAQPADQRSAPKAHQPSSGIHQDLSKEITMSGTEDVNPKAPAQEKAAVGRTTSPEQQPMPASATQISTPAQDTGVSNPIDGESMPAIREEAPPADTSSAENANPMPGISVYNPPSNNTPAAALHEEDPQTFEPNIEHAKAHQAALTRLTQNKRLLSDKELAEQEADQQAALAEVKNVLVRVKYPDQSMIETAITASTTPRDLYNQVNDTLASHGAAGNYQLKHYGNKGLMQVLPDVANKRLVKDFAFKGKVMVTIMWNATASAKLKEGPSLKSEYRNKAKDLKVELGQQRKEGEASHKAAMDKKPTGAKDTKGGQSAESYENRMKKLLARMQKK